MFKGLIVLAVLATGWVATLWFGVSPDFGHWSLPTLVAAHALPPLLTGGVWFGWRRWRNRRAEEQASAAETVAEKERGAVAEEARKLAVAEERRQRFGCDCRAVAMAQVLAGEDELRLAETRGGVYFSAFDPSQAELVDGTSVFAHLETGIREALENVYAHSPVVASLPVFVVPPTQARGDVFLAAVRTIQSALVEEWGTPPGGTRELGQVSLLADGRKALNGLVELFERSPGLSIVLLGSDSPWLHTRLVSEEDADFGAESPGQGVFALLLTHPELARAESDILSRERDALLSLPVLARLHRPAIMETGAGRKRATELGRVIGGLMAQARRNAGLGEATLADDASGAKKADNQGSHQECNWLVHNSGTPAYCGTRMAGVGVALSDYGIEIDPFEEGTNVSTAVGDLGDARSVGMLAVAVAKASATQGAALCVEFSGDEALSLFFARAPESGEATAVSV